MKHATSRELYSYWDRLRGTESAPLRSAIEPSDIRRILADTFIAEAIDPTRYNIRLAGTRVCALYGTELKGSNLLDRWSDDDRSALATLAAAVSEDGAAAVVSVDMATTGGLDTTCELLLLPLRHRQVGFDRILGSLAPFRHPTWLGEEPVTSQQIASLRLLWPDRDGSFERRGDAPSALRSAAAQSVAPIRKGRRHGHLYVVDGGKA